MRPNLVRGLLVFCASARYLSFKMAAEELCITPSAVSHQIKALEDRLGTTLFERRTRAIVLTPIGAALYSQVNPLLRSLDAVTSQFFRGSSRRRVLRMTVPPFFASEIVIPRLGEFSQAHPSLDIGVDTTAGRDEGFPSGSDAAVLLSSDQPSEVKAQQLFELKLVPACSPSMAAHIDTSNPASLASCTLIVHKSRPAAWAEWFERASIHVEVQPRIVLLDSMLAVAKAAEQGVGVALVPVPLSDGRFANGTLVKLFDAYLDTGERYYYASRLKESGDADIETLGHWIAQCCVGAESGL